MYAAGIVLKSSALANASPPPPLPSPSPQLNSIGWIPDKSDACESVEIHCDVCDAGKSRADSMACSSPHNYSLLASFGFVLFGAAGWSSAVWNREWKSEGKRQAHLPVHSFSRDRVE